MKKEFDESEKFTDNEQQTRLDSIKFGEKSLLVFDSNYYQMIDCGDSFLLVKIKSFKTSPLVTDFDSIPDEVMNSRRNIVIPKQDITALTVVMGEDSDFWKSFSEDIDISTKNEIDYCFGFSIECAVKDPRSKDGRTKKITYDLQIWEPVEEKPLHTFFAGVNNVKFTTYDEYKKSLNVEVSESGIKNAKRLNSVTKYASIISLAAGILTAFVKQNGVLLALRSVCIISLLLIFGLYFVCGKYFTFYNRRQYGLISMVDRSRVNIISSMVFSVSGTIFAWESMHAEIIQSEKSMLFALIILAVLMLIFVCINVGQGLKIRYYILFAFLALCASLYTINLINCVYDFSEPTVHNCMITETDNDNRYVTVIKASGEEITFRVTEEEFIRADRGDDVIVTEHCGALGMSWAELDIRFV